MARWQARCCDHSAQWFNCLRLVPTIPRARVRASLAHSPSLAGSLVARPRTRTSCRHHRPTPPAAPVHLGGSQTRRPRGRAAASPAPQRATPQGSAPLPVREDRRPPATSAAGENGRASNFGPPEEDGSAPTGKTPTAGGQKLRPPARRGAHGAQEAPAVVGGGGKSGGGATVPAGEASDAPEPYRAAKPAGRNPSRPLLGAPLHSATGRTACGASSAQAPPLALDGRDVMPTLPVPTAPLRGPKGRAHRITSSSANPADPAGKEPPRRTRA